MSRPPRLAIGTPGSCSDSREVLWGFLEVLRRQGLQVQSFRSQACFSEDHDWAAPTGARPRYLDSWLMSPETCRELFARGGEGADLSLVEGRLASARVATAGGGRLQTLCEWLDLPVLAVLNVADAARCRLPQRPRPADALLLDRVPAGEVPRWATNLEALWGIPVVGALEASPAICRAVRRAGQNRAPPADLLRELGSRMGEHWNFRRWQRLLKRPALHCSPPRLFRPLAQAPHGAPRIALAYDEAFHHYFLDALDLLELHGATITDFSPLRDDRLPPHTDVVYVGCGHPERHAARLASNSCMRESLRAHARRGGPIFAEGRGLAYLCETLIAADGQVYPMTGLFPLSARFHRGGSEPEPVEATLPHGTWLAGQGSRVRGYRDGAWSLQAAAGTDAPQEFLSRRQTVASRLNLNLTAQPHLLESFFRSR